MKTNVRHLLATLIVASSAATPGEGYSQNSTTSIVGVGTNQAISITTGTTPGVAIRPSATTFGYTAPEMFLRAVRNPNISPVKDSTLQLENLVGNIDIILPRREAPPTGTGLFATPTDVGVFSISKRVDNGTLALGQIVPILQLQPVSSGPDVMTLAGNFQVQDPSSSTITTLIDAQGIDTASLVTDSLIANSLQITDSVTGLPVALSINDGVIQGPSALFGTNIYLPSPGFVNFKILLAEE